MPDRIAIDCDLRSLTAVRSNGDIVCSRAPLREFIAAMVGTEGATLLYEVAGPAYSRLDSRASTHNQTRWAIYNAYVLGALCVIHEGTVLVAPSSKWTKGIKVKDRHKLANAKGRNKDVRECQTMLFFHARHPEDWVSVFEYMEDKL